MIGVVAHRRERRSAVDDCGQPCRCIRPLVLGPLFGAGVWAMSYVELVPMGLYEPPWKYPAKTLATDLSYHLVYGLFLGGSCAALDGR